MIPLERTIKLNLLVRSSQRNQFGANVHLGGDDDMMPLTLAWWKWRRVEPTTRSPGPGQGGADVHQDGDGDQVMPAKVLWVRSRGLASSGVLLAIVSPQ